MFYRQRWIVRILNINFFHRTLEDNQAPVAFKDGLRNLQPDEVPFAITPEMLLRGYETVCLNVIPALEYASDGDDSDTYSLSDKNVMRERFRKLCKVRENLIKTYHHEFMGTLIDQAIDKADRYKRVTHEAIKPGDIVLLEEKNMKRYLYPMGRVLSTETNSLGEVTAAYVMKGSTREHVYRHASSLILLLTTVNCTEAHEEPLEHESLVRGRCGSTRTAALSAREKIAEQSRDE